MAWISGKLTVTDDYQEFECPGSAAFIINVVNAAVDVGIGRKLGAGGGANYPFTDAYALPGSNVYVQPGDAVRFKHNVPGTSPPAIISIVANPRTDVAGLTLTPGYSPSYITVDPATGRVTADFDGVIRALGLFLPPAPNDFTQAENRVNWLRRGSANYSGTIYTSDTGLRVPDRRMQLGTSPRPDGDPLQGTPTSGIDIIDWPTIGRNEVTVFTRTGYPTGSAKLLDSVGRSGFVRVSPAADGIGNYRRYTFGAAAITPATPILNPGGTAEFVVNHFLGTTRVIAIGGIIGLGANNPADASWAMLSDRITTTQLTIRIRNVGTAALVCSWMGFPVAYDA